MIHLLRHLVGLVLVTALNPLAQAQSFTPVEDAHTYSKQRLSNYWGADLAVALGNTSASFQFKRSYLRFVVSGVDPSAIDCVTLELTESIRAGNVHFEVRVPQESWGETSLNWSNQPNSSGRRVGAWIGSQVSDGETLQIPLDPAVFRSGDGTYDLMLVEVEGGGLASSEFFSREDSAPPRLVFGCAGMAPRAGFAVAKTDGAVPFTPRFLPFIPEDASSVTWDFGDGSQSNDENPSHTYLTPGRYDVSLLVNAPGGSVSVTRSRLVMAYPADQAAGSLLSSVAVKPSSQSGAQLGLRDGDMFGRAVGAIGDLNGDGITDLIVGAIGDDDAGQNAGAVHVLAMAANGSIKGSMKITEGQAGFLGNLNAGDGFGREVAPIGDWDGDGVLDVAVGANRDDEDGLDAGAVWLLFLNANGSVKSHAKINASHGAPIGFNPGDEFGRGIARLEDMDGDGVPELAVGAINNRDAGNRHGCVWILFMRRDGSVKSAQKISNDSGGMQVPFTPNGVGNWWFGMSLSALGDVDGNGVTDIVVGALLDSARSQASGACVILLLNADGSVKQSQLINADHGGLAPGEISSNDELGGNCAGIGDLDGDGIPDVALASIRDDDNLAASTDYYGEYGSIYICFLNADGSIRDYQKISETRGALDRPVFRADRIGEGLAGLGDFDRDGVVDLLVGSRFSDATGLNQGEIYLYSLDNGWGGTAPVVAFNASQSVGYAPLSVSFKDRTIGTKDSWSWSFGDGSNSTLRSPTHVYNAPGSYDVSLTVSGALGEDRLIQMGMVQVQPTGSNILPYGSGINPAGSLQLLSGTGKLGTPLTFGVDNPLGSQAAGSVAFLTITLSPAPGFPAGTPLRNLGMDGGAGELLVSLATAPLITLAASPWMGAGNPVPLALSIPASPSLAGLTIYAQGRLLDRSAGAAVRLGLTEAFAITLIP